MSHGPLAAVALQQRSVPAARASARLLRRAALDTCRRAGEKAEASLPFRRLGLRQALMPLTLGTYGRKAFHEKNAVCGPSIAALTQSLDDGGVKPG